MESQNVHIYIHILIDITGPFPKDGDKSQPCKWLVTILASPTSFNAVLQAFRNNGWVPHSSTGWRPPQQWLDLLYSYDNDQGLRGGHWVTSVSLHLLKSSIPGFNVQNTRLQLPEPTGFKVRMDREPLPWPHGVYKHLRLRKTEVLHRQML
jgi:hypothetical protein